MRSGRTPGESLACMVTCFTPAWGTLTKHTWPAYQRTHMCGVSGRVLGEMLRMTDNHRISKKELGPLSWGTTVSLKQRVCKACGPKSLHRHELLVFNI